MKLSAESDADKVPKVVSTEEPASADKQTDQTEAAPQGGAAAEGGCGAADGAGSTASCVVRDDVSLSISLETIADKAERKAVHGFFRGNASLPPLDTQTVELSKGGTGQNIKVVYFIEGAQQSGKRKRGEEEAGGRGGRGGRGGGGRGGRGERRQEQWSGGANKFARFVMWKENQETGCRSTCVARCP
eukprot:gene22951-30135_t